MCAPVHTHSFLKAYFNAIFMNKLGFSKHSSAQIEKISCLNADSDTCSAAVFTGPAFQNPKMCIDIASCQLGNKTAKGGPPFPFVLKCW